MATQRSSEEPLGDSHQPVPFPPYRGGGVSGMTVLVVWATFALAIMTATLVTLDLTAGEALRAIGFFVVLGCLMGAGYAVVRQSFRATRWTLTESDLVVENSATRIVVPLSELTAVKSSSGHALPWAGLMTRVSLCWGPWSKWSGGRFLAFRPVDVDFVARPDLMAQILAASGTATIAPDLLALARALEIAGDGSWKTPDTRTARFRKQVLRLQLWRVPSRQDVDDCAGVLLAYALLALRRPKRAAEECRRLASETGMQPDVQLCMAMALLGSNEPHGARSLLEQCSACEELPAYLLGGASRLAQV